MTPNLSPVALLVACIGALPAQAQQAAGALDSWQAVAARLRAGEFEVIERLDGTRLSGTLIRVSGDVLEIDPRTRLQVPPELVPFGAIKMIRQARSDSLRDGAFKGMAAGAAEPPPGTRC